MKQTFKLTDYLGPLAVSSCFVVAIFLLSLFINFFWISKEDEKTIFDKFGSHFDIRCGIHRMRHRLKKNAKVKNKLMESSYGLEVDTIV
ncbi:hypothetical protein LOAG_09676 [Loa loa]|uniref:Uncharacterized protein n=1 Tax=Loa loa TaxID=7209 RepID=A0A1S0TRZ7_LOALO|nr:hypothetical protein LOAG_09676 [Loa loa]EFO18820.1 hypothetical protein LOAG_09676 [Loa loa]